MGSPIFPPIPSGGGGGSSNWGSITGTLSDQTDLSNVLDGKASRTAIDLTLYVYEDATGTGDGSSKANGFTTLQAAIDAIPDVAQNVTIIVCKGSTNYLGQTTTIQKASVKSLTIQGEFYAYDACDANAVAGKIVDASADFSDFEVGDRVVCTKYSGTVGDSAIEDYFYATITEVGEGYVQTSEETKVPTTGWRYLINQTVFDGDGGAGLYFVDVVGGVLGIGFPNHVNGINCGRSSNVTINSCIFDASVPSVVSYQDCKAYLRNSAVINIPSAMSGVYVDSGAYLLIKNTVFGAASLTTTTGIRLGPGCIGGNIEYCGFYGFNRGINNQNPVCNVSIVYAYFDSVCNTGAYGYNITLVLCTNNAATPVYNLTSGGSIEEWDGQALPSIDDATGGQVLALKSDKSALEFATVSGGGGITWNEVTGTTQAASADNGYITNNESLVTITLPSTCAVGKTIRVVGKGAGLWKIAQNAGQQIIFGNKNTTIGTSGYIASLYKYDSVELLCITADTVFSVTYAVGDLDVI